MIKPYTPFDRKEIEDMLIIEGIPDTYMCLDREGYVTYIMEEHGDMVGFFTIQIEEGILSLQHFCVKRSFRNATNARKLIRGVMTVIKDMGYTKFVIHPEKDYLDKICQHYFRKRPYAIQGVKSYYFVEVK